METAADREAYLSQLRLLLEEICCDVCRFHHVHSQGARPEEVRIDREVYLDAPGDFADIRVIPPGEASYFVEVKFGYSNALLLQTLGRKYGRMGDQSAPAGKIVLVVDTEGRPDWPQLVPRLAESLASPLKLEVWDENRMRGLLREQFGVTLSHMNHGHLVDVRNAIERAKGFYAFGAPSLDEYTHDALNAELIWHFGFWRLREFREFGKLRPHEILVPRRYPGVAVMLADLCSFSSYVRDTRDDNIIRNCLTSFYSKSRYQIINNGGMFYQFVGDEAIGLFGIPSAVPGYVDRALAAAKSLLHVGLSVSHDWQRRLDRVQSSRGLHIGMAIGDLQIVPLRPFSQTQLGGIADAINVAARLTASAGPGEIVVSNSFYNELNDASRAGFVEQDPLEMHNVGIIKAWKWKQTGTSVKTEHL
jgi:class 3 adenylate cyclase